MRDLRKQLGVSFAVREMRRMRQGRIAGSARGVHAFIPPPAGLRWKVPLQ